MAEKKSVVARRMPDRPRKHAQGSAAGACDRSDLALQETQRIAHIGSWSYDLTTGQLWWSAETYRLFGYDPEQGTITFERFIERVHADDRPKLLEAIRERHPSRHDYRVQLPDGSLRHIHEEVITERDTAGEITTFIGTAQDVTKQRLAEEQLRQSEEKYRLLFERSPLSILVLDASGVCIDCNAQYARLFGVAQDDYRGRNLLAQLQDDRMRSAVKAALGGVRGLFTGTYTSIASGRTVEVDALFSPLHTATGEVAGVIGIVEDRAERKKATEALQSAENLFRMVFERAAVGIVMAGPNRKIIDCNAAFGRMLGYAPSELIGKMIPDISVPEDEEENVIRMREAIENRRQTFSMDKRYFRKDGTVMQGSLTVSLVRESGGALTIIGFVEDIGERRRMEEALLNAQKLQSIGVLAGGIAHDFNNLLTAIVGNIGFAKMQLSPASGVVTLLTEAERACETAKDLSYRLLTFSEGGEPVKRPAVLAGLLLDTVRATLGGSAVKAVFDLPPDLPEVAVDPGQVKEVFRNLTLNAREAMPQGGNLRISLAVVNLTEGGTSPLKAGAYVKVSFTDHGVGIPAEHLPRIFDPYYTTKELGSHKGRGLGLAICHSIVRKHGGGITVESKEGQGSTFHVFFPLAAEAQAPEGTALSRSPAPKGRVLVMDDEDRVRSILQQMLEFFGCQVTTVREGAEAVERFRQAHEAGAGYDLVLLDLTVPGGMGGLEAFSRLRQVDPRARVAVMSGYTEDPGIKDFVAHGFVRALAKPFKPEDIRALLDEIRR